MRNTMIYGDLLRFPEFSGATDKRKIKLYAQLERLNLNSKSKEIVQGKIVLKTITRIYSGMMFGGRNE